MQKTGAPDLPPVKSQGESYGPEIPLIRKNLALHYLKIMVEETMFLAAFPLPLLLSMIRLEV